MDAFFVLMSPRVKCIYIAIDRATIHTDDFILLILRFRPQGQDSSQNWKQATLVNYRQIRLINR